MRHIKHVGLIMAALLVFLALIPSCAKGPAETGPIKIGAFLDYTGPNVGLGEMHEMGIKLALDEIGWQFEGRPIELLIEDTGGDPTITADKGRKFVDADKVVGIIGPIMEHCGAPVLAYTEQMQLPNIALMSHDLDMILEHDHLFAPLGGIRRYGYWLGRYAAEELGYRTASVLGPDFVAGHRIAQGFKTGFEEYGGVVTQEQFYAFGTLDWSPYLLAVEDVDTLHTFFLTPVDGMRAIDQHREYGIKAPIIHSYAETMDAVMHEYGPNLLGQVGQVSYNWTIDTEINKQFVAAFENQYGYKPTSFHANGYGAISLLLEAIKATGGDTTPSKLTEAMKGLSMDSPLGYFTLTEEGVGIIPRYIVQASEFEGTYAWKVIKEYPATKD